MPRELSQALWDAQHADVTDPYIIIFLSLFGESFGKTGRLLWQFQYEGIPDDYMLALLNAGDWTIRGTTPTSTNQYRDLLKNLGGVLFRRNGRSGSVSWGHIERSEDGGETWERILDTTGKSSHPYPTYVRTGYTDISRAGDGSLWSTWVDAYSKGSANPTEIWKSTDGGDSWSLSKTLSAVGNVGNWVVCDPEDSLRVAALINPPGAAPQNVRICITHDGGSSWSEITSTLKCAWNDNSWATNAHIVFGSGGRLVFHRPGQWYGYGFTPAEVLWTSDDYGATWTLRYSHIPDHYVGYNPTWYAFDMLAVGSTIYVAWYWPGGPLGNRYFIGRSTDNGDTWDMEWANEEDMSCGEVNHLWVRSIAWDPDESALYAARSYSQIATSLAAKWTESGGWVNVTYDLYDEAPDQNTGYRHIACTNGIDSIP